MLASNLPLAEMLVAVWL